MAGPVQPGAGGAGTVLVEGAPALAAAPATLELSVGLQTQAAALPLGRALVEVHCKDRRAGSEGVLPSSRRRDRHGSQPRRTPIIIIIIARIVDEE